MVTTVMSNLGLYKACDSVRASDYEKTAVGDKYVCENMVANGHSLGGEQSGHILSQATPTTGDGILTALMVMEVHVIREKKQPSELADPEVKIYPQLLKNVRVADKAAARERCGMCRQPSEVL